MYEDKIHKMKEDEATKETERKNYNLEREEYVFTHIACYCLVNSYTIFSSRN